MPNYCTNNLTVTGDAKEIKRFHEAIIKNESGDRKDYDQFSILDNLFPTPKELSENLRVTLAKAQRSNSKWKQCKKRT
jgi:hypothetical protein